MPDELTSVTSDRLDLRPVSAGKPTEEELAAPPAGGVVEPPPAATEQPAEKRQK